MTKQAHTTVNYLLNPTFPVSVNLIGCGGTGSHVLSALASINQSLLQLGHPGLFVQVWDNDTVSETNIGRQLFSPAELGLNKAVVKVSRINRFYGTDWVAINKRFNKSIYDDLKSTSFLNITISCVDSVRARREIFEVLYTPLSDKQHEKVGNEPYSIPYYWMDYGNLRKSGQVILGTIHGNVEAENTLPHLFDKFPNISDDGTIDTPSCSTHEALLKQDLFINSTLASLGSNILWSLFRDMTITNHGCFCNLENYKMNPLSIHS